MNKDVNESIAITGHQIGGEGLEGHVSAISGDGGSITGIVSLNAAGAHTHSLSGLGPTDASCLDKKKESEAE